MRDSYQFYGNSAGIEQIERLFILQTCTFFIFLLSYATTQLPFGNSLLVALCEHRPLGLTLTKRSPLSHTRFVQCTAWIEDRLQSEPISVNQRESAPLHATIRHTVASIVCRSTAPVLWYSILLQSEAIWIVQPLLFCFLETPDPTVVVNCDSAGCENCHWLN